MTSEKLFGIVTNFIFKKSIVSKSINSNKRRKYYDLLYKSNKLYYNLSSESYKSWQRREDLNNEAYSLLGSYHYKTHFKAAEENTESNYKYNKINKNQNSVFLLQNLLPNYYNSKIIRTEGDSDEKEDPLKFKEDQNSSDQSEDYKEFDKNYNPIKQRNKTKSDPEKMKILSEIAFNQKKNSFDYNLKKNEKKEKRVVRKVKTKKGNNSYAEENNIFIRNISKILNLIRLQMKYLKYVMFIQSKVNLIILFINQKEERL